MSILDFLKDKMLFIMINLILFIIVAFAMSSIGMTFVVMFSVFCIWFLPIGVYFFIDFIKYKKYFSEIERTLEKLDKKYLLPEVLNEPSFIEGKILNDILKDISKDMHENVKYYRDMQIEYEEYIETWVHEIKTPIASSKLIVENNNNEITKKIDFQIDRIEGFVEQVLYYAKSSDVSKDYIIKKFELNKVVRNVIKKNARDIIGRKIKLILDDMNEIVCSDEKWVEFILNQIIGNSIKYANRSDGLIHISSKEKDNSIFLIIEDNGVGIIDKDINRVFEKGFTGENGRIFGKATGMGLYLSKNLCSKLGLGIKIESKEKVGTAVTIVFPKSKLTYLQ